MKTIMFRLVLLSGLFCLAAPAYDPLNYNYTSYTSALYGLYYTGWMPPLTGVPASPGYFPSYSFPLGYSAGFPLGFQGGFPFGDSRTTGAPGWTNPRDIEFGATGLGTVSALGALSARGAEFGVLKSFPARGPTNWGAQFVRSPSAFSFRNGGAEMGLGGARSPSYPATPAGYISTALRYPVRHQPIDWHGSGLPELSSD